MDFKKRLIVNFIVHGIISFFLLYFFWALFSGQVMRWQYQNEQNRKSLLEIKENVRQYYSPQSVLESYSKFKSNELELRPVNNECWFIQMPPEFGTTEWRLYIGFENEKVSSVFVRSSDGPKPPDAPDDLGNTKSCGF